ncbi:UNVERIFIED_CONTAM: carboxypeptidase-like regulatory domain-containing protein, partial [Bacteroidetes bacterium 56_B9]
YKSGHLYVTLDSTYFVQKAILNVPKDINLNFVSRMTIEQIFGRTSDSTRIIKKDDISVNFKLSEKTKGMYARRLNVYSNQSFEEPNAEQAQ